MNLAALNLLEAGRNAQHGGLTAAGRPQKTYEFAGCDKYGNATDDIHAIKGVGQITDVKSAHGPGSIAVEPEPGREWTMFQLSRITGIIPAATIVKAPSADSSSSSSDAY